MPDASRPSFLRCFGRAAAARRGRDLADMGTAFALDEALELGACGSARPGDAKRAARTPKMVAPWRLWLGRKLAR